MPYLCFPYHLKSWYKRNSGPNLIIHRKRVHVSHFEDNNTSLSALISSHSHITSCDKRIITLVYKPHTNMSPRKPKGAKHADIFVLSLFGARPICGSSATTTQPTVGLCLQQHNEKPALFAENEVWKTSCFVGSNAVCCVFGGGM